MLENLSVLIVTPLVLWNPVGKLSMHVSGQRMCKTWVVTASVDRQSQTESPWYVWLVVY